MSRDRHRGGGGHSGGGHAVAVTAAAMAAVATAPSGGPGERSVYGVGPVREVHRAAPAVGEGRSGSIRNARARVAGDPVAQIVAAARAAGIRVEDRDRQTLDGAAGEGGRHQGVIAWLGAFGYADVDDMIPTRRARAARRARRRRGSAQPRRDPALGVPARRARRDHSRASRGAGHRGRREGVGGRERARADRAGRQPRARARSAARARPVARRRARASTTPSRSTEIDGTLPLVLVLGAEGTGVRPLVAKNCDFHALIPMQRTRGRLVQRVGRGGARALRDASSARAQRRDSLVDQRGRSRNRHRRRRSELAAIASRDNLGATPHIQGCSVSAAVRFAGRGASRLGGHDEPLHSCTLVSRAQARAPRFTASSHSRRRVVCCCSSRSPSR